MPYITPERRLKIDAHNTPTTIGELNYEITSTILDYFYANNFEINYTNINSVIGVLECAKLELYRRVAAPYEDVKKEENGDVY